MTELTQFDALAARLETGEHLDAAEIHALSATPDILSLGMLADTQRRRLHGTRVTYLRVASCTFDQFDQVPPAAREVRITGSPDTLAIAVAAVRQARAIAGDRVVSGLSWSALQPLAAGSSIRQVLTELKGAGLDAIAAVAIDSTEDLDAAVDLLLAAGFDRLRLTIDMAPAAARVDLLVRAGAVQRRVGRIQSINPLPSVLNAMRPTTGYDDVKMVAVARLAAPDISSVQVDWLRYGPKLAQVALTFGADDVDGVTPSDEAPEGRRRAPLEEVRRNIEAAGFTPVERDGGFEALS